VDWPTATVLIVLVSGLTLVLVAALRVLGRWLDNRTTKREKVKELITEASYRLRSEVNDMRSELGLPEK